jgi:asparagine synthase (glutamine-hydrolysing)
MCGIAGIIGQDLVKGAPAACVAAMAGKLKHRGPDGEGIWADGDVGLAHRRLAIIDIGGGAQPMLSPSGMVIVFNGEIYNYIELRHELMAKGRQFVSNSDTEVLLALFEEYGEHCVDRLVGMFAFAIWNPRRRRLFVARDRVGKKPFYYAHCGRDFAFASEIKALMALEPVRDGARLDVRALSDFLSFGYVLAPKTFHTNIAAMPAGHAGWFDADSGHWHHWDYWRVEQYFNTSRRPFDARAQECFTQLFDDAVRIRLRSDVSVGAFLSGGLDSAAVVESAARQQGEAPVLAFTVAFDDPSFDESERARMVAGHLGVPFACCEPTDGDELGLDALVEAADQPFADTSMIPTFGLCRAARRQVKVALSGDGADELLAGYATYRANSLYRWFRHVPRPVGARLRKAAEHVLRPSYRKVGWDFKIRQFLRAHGLGREEAHGSWRMYFSEAEKNRLLSPEIRRRLAGYDPLAEMTAWFRKVPAAPFLEQTLFVDLKTWLADDILVKVDRMSMANALEVRSPFLDHRLIEFVAQLDSGAKMLGRLQKVALRRHLQGRIPSSILKHPKRGFNAPTRHIAQEAMPPDLAPSVFQPDFRLDSAREDISYKGFALAVLGSWLRNNKNVVGLPDEW